MQGSRADRLVETVHHHRSLPSWVRRRPCSRVYWDCLSPQGGGEAQGDLAAALQRDFGSFATFQKAMSEAAVKLYRGSGWAWLAADKAGEARDHAVGRCQTRRSNTPRSRC